MKANLTLASGARLRTRAAALLLAAKNRGCFPTVRRSTLRVIDVLPIDQPFTAQYLADTINVPVSEAREELEVLAYALRVYAKGILQLQRSRPRRHHIGRGGKPADIFRITLAPRPR